ncbi:MAG: glutathione S-transferase N-terminal domain-containing protein [Nannocystaceae bacterium]|nr:glutathione S-transferase N-terminal domain-containing protein [Myxococcales bacterium]
MVSEVREVRLFGTDTSPYVRRVRVVARELGVPLTLVDIRDEAGEAALRERTPIWKVPVAELDGALVLDSAVICDRLVAGREGGELSPVRALADRNAITVIDGALDSLINCFYLTRSGVDADVAYLQRQRARAESALAWLDARVDDGMVSADRRFGLPEVALATAAAWIRFRDVYPVDRHAGVIACLERCEARESFARTRPPA